MVLTHRPNSPAVSPTAVPADNYRLVSLARRTVLADKNSGGRQKERPPDLSYRSADRDLNALGQRFRLFRDGDLQHAVFARGANTIRVCGFR